MNVVRDEYEDENDADAAEVAAQEQQALKAKRQLSRGFFARMTEKLTGGPERPGEQKIGRTF